jgi:hypothetical protein
VTTDFDVNNNDTSTADYVSSSVPDTPTVNSNPEWSKNECTYKRTMHYDPMTGNTIGAEATALINYNQFLKGTDGKIKFANMGAGIGGGFENTMELKPMKYIDAINGLDGEAWKKK